VVRGGGSLRSYGSLKHRPPTIARRAEARKFERAVLVLRVPPSLMPAKTREASRAARRR
jgi:hypothetical protein